MPRAPGPVRPLVLRARDVLWLRLEPEVLEGDHHRARPGGGHPGQRRLQRGGRRRLLGETELPEQELALGDPPLERWAVAKDDGDFDQFTGATITPRAVVKAIKDALLFYADHRDILTAPPVINEPAPEAPQPR